jgi:hypothetical protein
MLQLDTVTNVDLEREIETEENMEVLTKIVPIKKEPVDDDYFIIIPED